ncbi:MAG: hypothetical protein DIU52_005835 [bacterium]|jgi:hypothetical protein
MQPTHPFGHARRLPGTVLSGATAGCATLALLATVMTSPLSGQAPETERYRLPPVVDWEKFGTSSFPEVIKGLPLSLDAVSVAPVGDRKVLWIPVLMNEPKPPVEIESVLLDPIDWRERRVSSREIGRRSLHFLEPGTTMLYGVLIDPDPLDPQRIGVGLVVVTRLDQQRYDVIIESNSGEGLAAARGRLQVIDPSVGMGALVRDEDGSEVRRKYSPRWDLDPRDSGFPLFSQGRSRVTGARIARRRTTRRVRGFTEVPTGRSAAQSCRP